MSLALFRPTRESVCLQQRWLEKWVHRQLGSIDHEKRVVEIASRLFDLTWPLHGLTGAERRLLRLAAVVHDVGRCIDDETHPEVGARLIHEWPDLPLEPDERRALAYLTRYHRGKVPPVGGDEILRRCDDHETLRLVLAMLRSADGLDGRNIESPRLQFDLIGRRLQINCLLEQDTPKARKVYARRKKHRLLEELCDCRVEIRIAPLHSLRLVA